MAFFKKQLLYVLTDVANSASVYILNLKIYEIQTGNFVLLYFIYNEFLQIIGKNYNRCKATKD